MQVSQPKKGYKFVDIGFRKYEEIPEDWKFESLSEICIKITDGTHKTPKYVENGIPFLSTENIKPFQKGFDFSRYVKYITKEEHEQLIKRCKPEKGDILISKCGTIGRTKLIDVDKEISIFVGLMLLKVNEERIYGLFLEQLLNSSKYQDYMKYLSPGSTRKTLAIGTLSTMKIILPSLTEQQKIVSILSNVDDTLEKTNQLIRTTELLKKGLMQKLFSKGIGHTKFKKVKWLFEKEIEIPKEWKIQNLGTLCSQIVDGPHVSPNYVEKGIPFLTVNNIIDGFFNLENVKFISKEDHQVFSKRAKPEFGDVLYTKGGTTGIAKIIDVNLEFSIWVHLALLKVKNDVIDSKYLELFLNSYLGKKQARLQTYGIANKDLVLGRMKQILISIPPVKEQKAIASILSNIDSQITKEKLQKSNLKLLKKGLMQKLLTGKIRVKF